MSNVQFTSLSPASQRAIERQLAIQNAQELPPNGAELSASTANATLENDEFVSSSEVQPPKIGFLRIAFSRLTNEQIAQVNKTKKLPKNAKFKDYCGHVAIKNNIFNITKGTKTLPAGYEVRKNWLGFTRVVRVDSEGLFLRKKPEQSAEV